jgi:Cu+-exporting ATPase
MLTGESLPVDKEPGATVFGATINRTGSFVFEATRVGRDTTLAQIVRLVEEAQGSKAPMQRLADEASSRFVPLVLVLAALTFAGWMILRPEPQISYAIQAAIAAVHAEAPEPQSTSTIPPLCSSARQFIPISPSPPGGAGRPRQLSGAG